MIDIVARRLRENIQKVIVGRDEAINLTLVAVLCEGHLLIEDVPGIGKTTLARSLAASLGCSFRRIQFTPDLLPSDVTGLNWFNQKEQVFEFRPGPVMSQVLLADEINRATPRTQSALLEAMQERQVTGEGTRQPAKPRREGGGDFAGGKYIVPAAGAPRQPPEIELGASPRATLS